MKQIWLLLFLVLNGLPACLAQHASVKTDVNFDCTCDDSVGRLYATAFRDLIASSPRYSLASVAEVKGSDGKTSKYNLNIKVVTLDDDASGNRRGSGISTVISVVLLVGDDPYLDNLVQTCGRDVVASCAASTLAYLDEVTHRSLVWFTNACGGVWSVPRWVDHVEAQVFFKSVEVAVAV